MHNIGSKCRVLHVNAVDPKWYSEIVTVKGVHNLYKPILYSCVHCTEDGITTDLAFYENEMEFINGN